MSHDAPVPPEAAAPEEERPEGGAVADDGDAAELARLAGERDEYLDALQRVKAEFDNYRKRTERERQTTALAGVREVVRGLLPVLDNLERAVAALGGRGESVTAGLEMVHGQLAGLLVGHGVQEIPAAGESFDPTVHEAIAQAPAPGVAAGTVVEVVEKGYRHTDHVLRPSRVVVAAEPAAAPGPPDPANR